MSGTSPSAIDFQVVFRSSSQLLPMSRLPCELPRLSIDRDRGKTHYKNGLYAVFVFFAVFGALVLTIACLRSIFAFVWYPGP